MNKVGCLVAFHCLVRYIRKKEHCKALLLLLLVSVLILVLKIRCNFYLLLIGENRAGLGFSSYWSWPTKLGEFSPSQEAWCCDLSLADGNHPAEQRQATSCPSPSPSMGIFNPPRKDVSLTSCGVGGKIAWVSTCITPFSQKSMLTGEKRWFPRPTIGVGNDKRDNTL